MAYDENLRKLFEDRFGAYRFPFKSANAEIGKLDSKDKMRYLEDAASLLKSDLWKIELGELYRTLFYELAFKSSTDEEREAYRMMIMFLDRWETRLLFIAKQKTTVEFENALSNT